MAEYVDDPDDGLPVEVVGAWAEEKHARLVAYVHASSAARKKFARSETAYIDLFCGPGRSKIRHKNRLIDGGAVAACRRAHERGAPFSVAHIGDADPAMVDACARRLKALGENVVKHQGPAENTVDDVLTRLNVNGLHLAYLDPYNLAALPFTIIERLACIRRMDMIIHVSVQDLQRNLKRYFAVEPSPLDEFAPAWRTKVHANSQPNAKMRAVFLEHWVDLVRGLDMAPSRGELIQAPSGQRLYWLMFASRNPTHGRVPGRGVGVVGASVPAFPK